MHYVRLHVVVALLGLALPIEVVGQALINANRENVENGQGDRGTYFQRALADLWKVIPEKTSINAPFPLKALSFLGTTSYALAVGANGKILWFDAKNLATNHLFDSGHTEISVCTISKDGEWFAVAGNGVVTVWARNAAPATFSCISTHDLTGHITALALDGARSELLIGTKNGKIIVRPLREATDVCAISIARFEESLQIFNKVVGLYPGGNGLILAAGYIRHNDLIKPSVRFFDRGGHCLKEVVIDCAAIQGKLVFIDEAKVRTSFTNGLIMTTNLATSASEKIECKDYAVEMSQFSADKRLLLTGCQNKKLVLWHTTPSGYEKIRELEVAGHIMNCGLSADGSALLVHDHTGLALWSVDRPFSRLSVQEVQGLIDSNAKVVPRVPVVQRQRDPLLEEIERELKILERLLTNK